jgi:hypothetical protein
LYKGPISSKCVNSACSASFRGPDEGKLFRIDIDIGSNSGSEERKTEYIWLCGRCARTLNPTINVAGNVLTVKLLATEDCRARDVFPPPVN